MGEFDKIKKMGVRQVRPDVFISMRAFLNSVWEFSSLFNASTLPLCSRPAL